MSRGKKNRRSPESPLSPGHKTLSPERRETIESLAVCGFLVLAVFLVFGRTLDHGFINYDDNKYVSENRHVAGGLTAEGIGWAFTSRQCSNWHPLTWLSHMADCQLYDLKPWGHHLSSLLLHAATAVVLFLVLRRMTGETWPSTFVAAVFAIHPLRVESVAWVAERKDVLNGLCFALTLAAYVGYVRHRFSWARYLAVIGFFALGLMAKPMLVTLPFVLLLLDYWPLGRLVAGPLRVPSASFCWGGSSSAATPEATVQLSPQRNLDGRTAHGVCLLLVEKLPLFALSAASCAITVVAQRGAMESLAYTSMATRIGNAAVSYVAYLGQMFWPTNLAVIYPHPGSDLPAWQVAAALGVLAAISAGVAALCRRAPYLLVGWLWYLGMLVPVIGLVQVGLQARADRYTYLPQIGLYIAIAWGIADLCSRPKAICGAGVPPALCSRDGRTTRSWRWRGWICGVAAASVLAVLMGLTYHQASFWRDSETLFVHALECTTGNAVAHCNLGIALVDRGEIEKGIEHYREALRIDPNSVLAHNDLGEALQRLGRDDLAIGQFEAVLQLAPNHADALYNLGESLRRQGKLAEAVVQFTKSLILDPDRADAHTNLGAALGQQGRTIEAIAQFNEALRIDPGCVEAWDNLGVAYAAQGRLDEAIQQYRQALRLAPSYAPARRHLEEALRRAAGQ
jgi:tetratricopeptide (TPR) repeat protein